MVKRINRISRRQFLKIVGTGALTFGLSSLFLEGCDDLDEIVEGLLTTLINDYREQHGLPRIPVSSKLTTVALKHVTDLDQYHPENNCGGNLHSWSSHGNWTGGCYDSSNSSTWSIMWDKPKEITGYPTNGYEIAYWSSGSATPQDALDTWKSSPAHNDVILNQGVWANYPWKALGAWVLGNYACAWFGETPD